MAKRMSDTAPENSRIFISSICDLTNPTETHHGCGDGQHKSISGPFDKTTFPGATGATPRTHALRDGARPRSATDAVACRRGDRVKPRLHHAASSATAINASVRALALKLRFEGQSGPRLSDGVRSAYFRSD